MDSNHEHVPSNNVHQNILDQFLKNPYFAYPANLDIVNITLLLRSAGFELKSFNFCTELPSKPDKEVSIEIKCGQSGIVSQLCYTPLKCDCPEKPSSNDEHSFWEIQGTQPNSSFNNSFGSSNTVKMASSNLLPHVNKSWELLTQNMFGFLTRLHENYPESSSPSKSVSKTFNGSVTVQDQIAQATTIVANMEPSPKPSVSKSETPFSTPLSSINITPITTGNTESTLNGNIPNILVTNENNTTQRNENNYESFIIQEMMEARSKIDQALLLMTLNSSQNLNGSSISIDTTPTENVLNGGLTLNSVNRRLSCGSIPTAIGRKSGSTNSISSREVSPAKSNKGSKFTKHLKDTSRRSFSNRSATNITEIGKPTIPKINPVSSKYGIHVAMGKVMSKLPTKK